MSNVTTEEDTRLTEIISFRTTKKTKSKLEEEAATEKRSANSQLQIILEKHYSDK